MNKCPHCGGKSSFSPEEMECDKGLVLWCNNCGNFVNQTLTIETIRRWWIRYDEGEETIVPPVSKKNLMRLMDVEQMLNEEGEWMESIEIHIKDFRDYSYTEDKDNDKRTDEGS
ncbi:hypothetical protein [Paenibacillus sp. NPDC057967]|uniref:hypothetical protein n=1 Tax=Paenibacillus sp. NPDC057967 TaxID=3346293 RepID=UPI0036DED7E6